MQHIQTIIFDLGGVIINLKPEQDWVQQDMLSGFNEQRLLEFHQNFVFQDFEKGKIASDNFIQQLRSIAMDTSSTNEQIIHYWNGILLDIPQHRVDFLEQLKSKYRLLLLSNTNHIHMDFIRVGMQQKFGEDILARHFHHCYYSQEIGLRKPDKEIYEFVMQDQQIHPSEILFLDDKAENLAEPQKLGWQTQLVSFNKLSSTDLQHLF